MSRVAPIDQTRLLIHHDAIAHNLRAMRALLPPGIEAVGVVKADAYGHGLVGVARLLQKEGIGFLATAFLSEARVLRQAGLELPIIVLAGVEPDQASRAVALGVTPVVDRVEMVEALARAGRELGIKARCHLKMDSGMNRLGLRPPEVLEALELSRKLEGLEVSGVASHLATSGEPGDAYAAGQAKLFGELLAQARQSGFPLPEASLWASGGVLAPPLGGMEPPGLARLGISLYGGLPSPGSAGIADLQGAMSFVTRLHAVRPVSAGSHVSYGCTWTARQDTWLGVLPVGYSDGYPRQASNRAQVLIGGKRAPVRGRVCMNLTMVDLTGFDPLPLAGDQVVLLGRQGKGEITVEELASWADTISYDITCSLGAANRRRLAPLDQPAI